MLSLTISFRVFPIDIRTNKIAADRASDIGPKKPQNLPYCIEVYFHNFEINWFIIKYTYQHHLELLMLNLIWPFWLLNLDYYYLKREPSLLLDWAIRRYLAVSKKEREKKMVITMKFSKDLCIMMRQNAWQMPPDNQVSNYLIMEWNFRYVYKLHTDAFHVCFFEFPNVINIFRWNLILHSISG